MAHIAAFRAALAHVAYRYDPHIHGFLAGEYPADRPTAALPNKMPAGKPQLRRVLMELQQIANRVPRRVPGRDDSAERTGSAAWALARESLPRVDAYVAWALRGMLDRIGVLEDAPTSFLDLYERNGPVCRGKPAAPTGGRQANEQYRRDMKRWKQDATHGQRLLRSIRTHAHEIRYAAESCAHAIDLRAKLVRALGLRDPVRSALAVQSAPAALCQWVAAKFGALEKLVAASEKCTRPDSNELLHGAFIRDWRADRTYRGLVRSILGRRLADLNAAGRRDYRRMVSVSNSWL